MAEAAINTFIQFFKEFIKLCSSYDWPNDNTSREEITKAMQIAHHVELAINKMKLERNFYEGFSKLVFKDENCSHTFFQNCMRDPPKFVLKKIINSDADVRYIDYAFDAFKMVYSVERLVGALSDLIVEAASVKTLLNNMSTVLSDDQLLELKRHLHLMTLLQCESEEALKHTLVDCGQDIVDTIVLCLVSDNVGGLKKEDTKKVRRKIITGIIDLMNSRGNLGEKFWKQLFSVDRDNLVEMCLQYESLREMMFDVLIHNLFLNKTDHSVSSDLYFSVDQLESNCKTLFENETLKFKFTKFLDDKGYDKNDIKRFLND